MVNDVAVLTANSCWAECRECCHLHCVANQIGSKGPRNFICSLSRSIRSFTICDQAVQSSSQKHRPHVIQRRFVPAYCHSCDFPPYRVSPHAVQQSPPLPAALRGIWPQTRLFKRFWPACSRTLPCVLKRERRNVARRFFEL